MAHDYIASEASSVAQKVSASMTYGGAAFSVFQWFASNANWVAAFVGIVVTIAGFIWNRIDAKKKESEEKKKRELEEFLMMKEETRRQEEHEARMIALRSGVIHED